jgi:DNA-binding transcriptional LysR family regulator
VDLNEMVVFARVVQAGSFTAAARALGMPKSTVSRKISDLEDRLGARLLQRTTRKLSLTDVGRVYYEHCARVVAEVEEAELAVTQMHAAPRGQLRVTTPLTFSFLAPVVAEYLKRHAQVQVEVVCTDRRVDLIEEGFDLALRAGQLGDSSLIARRVGHIRTVLVAAPDYLERRGVPASPAELEKHDCIVFGGTPGNERTFRQGHRLVEVTLQARLVVNDFEMLREAAAEGLGIAAIPDYLCAADIEAGRLQSVLEDWHLPDRPVHALYPSTRHLPAKVAAFLDVIRERLRLSSAEAQPHVE